MEEADDFDFYPRRSGSGEPRKLTPDQQLSQQAIASLALDAAVKKDDEMLEIYTNKFFNV